MQNQQTLKELGFQINPHGEYFWRGQKRTFVAAVVDFNGPKTFVELFVVSDKVDMRPRSDRKGRHYKSLVKQCCSEGSVQRALKTFDL